MWLEALRALGAALGGGALRAALATHGNPGSQRARDLGDCNERDTAVHVFMEAVEAASAVTQPEDSREAAVAALASSGAASCRQCLRRG